MDWKDYGFAVSREFWLWHFDLIQVDIGGHPPIPLEPPPFLLSVFQFLHSLLFLAVFSGPELPGPF
jgi:hypothetical protein